MAVCKRCDVKQDWTGSPRECAFTSGTFDTRNWNCGTMNALRSLLQEDLPRENHGFPRTTPLRFYGHDHSLGIVPYEIPNVDLDEDNWLGEDEGWLIMGWYKNRGRTDQAWLVSYSGQEPLTLKMAEAILASVEIDRG